MLLFTIVSCIKLFQRYSPKEITILLKLFLFLLPYSVSFLLSLLLVAVLIKGVFEYMAEDNYDKFVIICKSCGSTNCEIRDINDYDYNEEIVHWGTKIVCLNCVSEE